MLKVRPTLKLLAGKYLVHNRPGGWSVRAYQHTGDRSEWTSDLFIRPWANGKWFDSGTWFAAYLPNAAGRAVPGGASPNGVAPGAGYALPAARTNDQQSVFAAWCRISDGRGSTHWFWISQYQLSTAGV